MQWPTCTQVQPLDDQLQELSTRCQPHPEGSAIAWLRRSLACCNMLAPASWRRAAMPCPSLSACSSVMPGFMERVLRGTAARRHSPRVAASQLAAEATQGDVLLHSRSSSRGNEQNSGTCTSRRRIRRGAPTHREPRARKRSLPHEPRRRLLPALSPVARLLWRCRLLPRNHVHRDPSSTLGDGAEEPPLPASRTATETEWSCGLRTQSTMRPTNRRTQLNRVSAFGSQHDKPGRQQGQTAHSRTHNHQERGREPWRIQDV